MRIWRNIFYSFLIFAGILILTILIEQSQIDSDRTRQDRLIDSQQRQLSQAAHLRADRIASFIRARRIALRAISRFWTSLPELDEQQLLAGIEQATRGISGIDAAQLVAADRQTIKTITEHAGRHPAESLLRTDPEIGEWLTACLARPGAVSQRTMLFENSQPGLLLAVPIPRAQGPTGWLIWSMAIDTIVHAEYPPLDGRRPFGLVIEDPKTHQLLYGDPNEIKLAGERVGYGSLNIADELTTPSLWNIKLGGRPDSADVPLRDGARPSPLFFLGALISLIAGVLIFLILSRGDRLEAEVAERVRDVEASQNELRAIIEAAPMAILGYDESHRIFLWNPMCEQVFGHSRQEAEGRLMGEMVATEAHGETKSLLERRAFDGSPLQRLSWQTKRKDGKLITCGGSATAVEHAESRQQFALLICNDITAQRELEAEIEKYTKRLEQVIAERTGELAESETRHRQLLSTAKDALVGIDDSQRISFFNLAAERAFGYATDEVIGQPIWVILPKARASAGGSIAPFLQAGQTQRIGITRELSAKRKDGDVFPVEVSLSVFTLKDKPHFTAIIRDIAARKRMDERIEQMIRNLRLANQEMEDFTYVVSHDMKAPLRAVKNMSQFLAEDCADQLDARGCDYLQRLQDSVTLMSQLIDDLLHLSHISAMKPEPALIETDAIIEKVLSILKPSANVEVRYSRELPAITCTPAKIEQVFLNLISNGIKYNDREKIEIEIGHILRDNEFLFYVKDNGIGIDKQYQYRIFQLFQRLHKRNEYDGTGIGLTIARKVVQEHGGRIWFESEEGVGTTFFFTIPKSPVEAVIS
ncbi:PAS domain S-box protein [Candidatus Sumerlaeota bacterium]